MKNKVSFTKQILANGKPIATVEGTGASATVHYVHTDHLGGTNVTTNTAGTLEQVLDYYPFGTIRTDYDTTSFDPRRKFTGHEYDSQTGLYYMQQRYQNAEIGRFVSQDPRFWSEKIRLDLPNPQMLNSYSYTVNNPTKLIDPNGENPATPFLIGGFVGGVVGLIGVGINSAINQHVPTMAEIGVGVTSGAAVGVASVYGALTAGAAVFVTSSVNQQIIAGSINIPQTILEVALTLGTGGILKSSPQVPGIWPNPFTESFFFGQHTKRKIKDELIDLYGKVLGSQLYNKFFNTSSNSSGGSSSNSQGSNNCNCTQNINQSTSAQSSGPSKATYDYYKKKNGWDSNYVDYAFRKGLIQNK